MTTASMASVRPTQVGLFTLLHFPAGYVVDAILFEVSSSRWHWPGAG